MIDADALNAVWPAAGLVVVAFVLRLGIHLGRTPGGVDTWYFMMYVRELHRTRRFPVRLPQYLLQDEVQTYPPLFPLFLGLFPMKFLERHFWLLSPALDVIQLLLLYVACLKITGSVTTASLAGLVYAFMPQLIAENRSLNSRALGALLNSAMMLALFRATIAPEPAYEWYAVALVLAAALLLAHKLATQSFVFTSLFLTVVLQDWRYLAFAAAAFVAAYVLSFGFYRRVLEGHWDVVRFWRHNTDYIGAHQVLDSPLFGGKPVRAKWYYAPGLYGQLKLLARLLGENPFILAMLVTPVETSSWGRHMYWWAVAVLIWAFLTTFVPPLRCFGQGHLYMKFTAFPTAYTLALGVGISETTGGIPALVGLFLSLSFLLSIAAIFFLYYYHRNRRTEHTSEVPSDLKEVAYYLRETPQTDVLCLPVMYADYLAFHTDKRIYWGGHNSGFKYLEPFCPVLRVPLDELTRNSQRCLLILDRHYLDPSVLGVDGETQPEAEFGSFAVYRFPLTRSRAAGLSKEERAASSVATAEVERRPSPRASS